MYAFCFFCHYIFTYDRRTRATATSKIVFLSENRRTFRYALANTSAQNESSDYYVVPLIFQLKVDYGGTLPMMTVKISDHVIGNVYTDLRQCNDNTDPNNDSYKHLKIDASCFTLI